MTQYTRVPLRRERKNRRPALPGWALGVLLGVFLLATLFSAYLVFSTVRNFVASWKITDNGPATPVASAGTDAPSPTRDANSTADPQATEQLNSTPVPTVDAEVWTGSERVMILVM